VDSGAGVAVRSVRLGVCSDSAAGSGVVGSSDGETVLAAVGGTVGVSLSKPPEPGAECPDMPGGKGNGCSASLLRLVSRTMATAMSITTTPKVCRTVSIRKPRRCRGGAGC
jgi:hypothetical protein